MLKTVTTQALAKPDQALCESGSFQERPHHRQLLRYPGGFRDPIELTRVVESIRDAKRFPQQDDQTNLGRMESQPSPVYPLQWPNAHAKVLEQQSHLEPRDQGTRLIEMVWVTRLSVASQDRRQLRVVVS